MEWGNPLLDDHVLALSGVERPKICFLPTASGDADHYVPFLPGVCRPGVRALAHLTVLARDGGG